MSKAIEYQIRTERKNMDFIKMIVSSYYKGFEIEYKEGFWEGIEEDSVTITIICNPIFAEDCNVKLRAYMNHYDTIKHIADFICNYNQQECVCTTKKELETNWIYNKKYNKALGIK
jgi:hypothetical protein